MDEVDFWVAFGGARCLMDVMAAEVAAKIKSLVYWKGCKVLVAEDWRLLVRLVWESNDVYHTNDLPLGSE